MQEGALKVVEAGVPEIEVIRRGDAKRESLEGEIRMLREALGQAIESMRLGEEGAAKTGGTVARLSDSIVRALLAQQKLSAQSEGFVWLRAQFDRMLRELGEG